MAAHTIEESICTSRKHRFPRPNPASTCNVLNAYPISSLNRLGHRGQGLSLHCRLLLQLGEFALYQLLPGAENFVYALEEPIHVLAMLLGVPFDFAELY